MTKLRIIKNKKRTLIATVVVMMILYYFALPSPLFQKPTSTVILSKEGRLLGARIAADGQWRFPKNDSVPEKFKQSIITFEDQYFYYHPGVNLGSLARAAWQDVLAGKIVSGGSTLSMQVIRLSKDHPKRNFYEKFKEIILATRLEFSYSKDEILSLYAANAPFGSNVVGLEAAAWRFFGRKADDLSWAEAATLAVLPNAPSLIYPGKNAEKLRNKRNRLLHKMMMENIIDSLTYELSLNEPLPRKVRPLPNIAPHLLQLVNNNYPSRLQTTTIDYELQKSNLQVLRNYAKNLQSNHIYNAAIIVVEVKTGNVLSYIGNTEKINDKQDHANYVDVIQARRSSGSILKPILYAYMLEEGFMLPKSMVKDIPTEISGYQPENYNRQFTGVVPADEALQRSLNVPAVRELQEYGYPRFYLRLKNLGFTSIDRSADNYGLTLILGGAEVKLWNLAKVYSSMARVLNNYAEKGYDKSDWHEPYFTEHEKPAFKEGKFLQASSIWFAFEAMRKLNRPQSESGWQQFSSTRKVAWKTGTSHGFRDAWAVGIDSKYMVGVWVGNADGEGRAGITGLQAAAPLLFQIFDHLPQAGWFEKPILEMAKEKVCMKTGFRASPTCPDVQEKYIPRNGENSALCPYHKLIHLDASGQYQVTSDCESVHKMIHQKRFVLPPVAAWYYQQQHPEYSPPPPFRADCINISTQAMAMIYPKSGAKLFIPMEHSGERGAVVFRVAHKQPNIKIYWHLDGKYLDYTQGRHEMTLSPNKGKHLLSLIDENGENIICRFWVK